VVEDTCGSRRGQETLRPAAGGRPAEAEWTAPAGPPDGVLLDRSFGRDDIAVVRHQVQDHLGAAGVDRDRLHGFVLAVNEVITNVLLHAGGHGRIVVRVAADAAWCTVIDSGPGIPGHLRRWSDVPDAFEVGGRGIWLAHQLCDEVTMATGPVGTTIGLRIAVTPGTRPRM
jgi:anti-sigma regulatory factor (Ser/Thr protein kinase)